MQPHLRYAMRPQAALKVRPHLRYATRHAHKLHCLSKYLYMVLQVAIHIGDIQPSNATRLSWMVEGILQCRVSFIIMNSVDCYDFSVLAYIHVLKCQNMQLFAIGCRASASATPRCLYGVVAIPAYLYIILKAAIHIWATLRDHIIISIGCYDFFSFDLYLPFKMLKNAVVCSWLVHSTARQLCWM